MNGGSYSELCLTNCLRKCYIICPGCDNLLLMFLVILTHQICKADIIHCIIALALDCGLDFNFISLLAIISCHWRGLSPVDIIQYGNVPPKKFY